MSGSDAEPGPRAEVLGDWAKPSTAETYEAALWEIYRLSGKDTDGDEGPGALIAGMGHAGFARAVVDGVRELREDYDASPDPRTLVAPKVFEELVTWLDEDDEPAPALQRAAERLRVTRWTCRACGDGACDNCPGSPCACFRRHCDAAAAAEEA